MAKSISFTIKYWKQNGPQDQGHFDTHEMKNIPDDTSFLEMLDILNEELIAGGEEPFVFDHDVFTLHQRNTSWKDRTRCNNLPTLHASFQRWRHYHR